VKEQGYQRVLFVTYRQTLARDIMRNFGKLGFKHYIDSYSDTGVWESPRLIIQIDSLFNLLYRNTDVTEGGSFDLNYDVIVLDESESSFATSTKQPWRTRKSTYGISSTRFSSTAKSWC